MKEPLKSPTGRLEGRYTAVAELPFYYRVSVDPVPAQRLPVVLVHGQVVSSRYMVPLAEHLAPEFRVYAPDLPGFGKSGKPHPVLDMAQLADALAAWLDEMKLERVNLIGNSMGCNVLVELALRHGERIARLVLEGPVIDPAARTAYRQTLHWLMNGWREPAMGGVVFKDFAAAGPRRAVLTFRHLLRHFIEEKLPAVQVPTLVVRGARDPIVPRRWACQVVKLLPDARLLEIPEGAHTLHYFKPQALVQAVRPFFLELDGVHWPAGAQAC